MKTSLRESLKKLRLGGLAGSLEVRLTEASSSRLTHEEFLELIVQDEMAVRRDRLKPTALASNWSLNPLDPTIT